MFPKRRPTFEKTQSEKLILPELADIIARSPTGDLTFPVNDYGVPWASAKAFQNKMKDWCEEAAWRDRGGRERTPRPNSS
jgi:hypothetical protein